MNSVADRFWSKVGKTNDCWEWLAYRNEDGYGTFRDGKKKRAHRVAWELTNGPIPEGLFACHSCDNRGCVRPSHLFIGNGKTNMQDALRKGRLATKINGKNKGGYRKKLSRVDDIKIMNLRAKGITVRSIALKFNIHRSSVIRSDQRAKSQ